MRASGCPDRDSPPKYLFEFQAPLVAFSEYRSP
jgi:hypothetical protein